MTNVTNWRNLLFELENEFARIESENATLREKLSHFEMHKISSSAPEINRVDWVELESGKRFLTTKDLGKYLGLSPATIANQRSRGMFPIRHRKMGKSVRFDMQEVLEYLKTDKPFWERDRELKKRCE